LEKVKDLLVTKKYNGRWGGKQVAGVDTVFDQLKREGHHQPRKNSMQGRDEGGGNREGRPTQCEVPAKEMFPIKPNRNSKLLRIDPCIVFSPRNQNGWHRGDIRPGRVSRVGTEFGISRKSFVKACPKF